MATTIEIKRDELVKRAMRKIQGRSTPLLSEIEIAVLSDYFDEAVIEIKKWKKLKDDKAIINGEFDTEIVRFIVESDKVQGSEGLQAQDGSDGKFIATPLANLQSSISQRIG